MLIDVSCEVGTAFVDIHYKQKGHTLCGIYKHPSVRDLTSTPVQTDAFPVKTGAVRINVTSKPLLQWKSDKYYVFRVRVCSLSYTARKAHAPYNIFISGLSDSTIFFHIISQTTRLSE